MDKKVVKEVLERSGGLCELCGSNEMVQLHHVVGGSGKRTQHECTLSVMALCWKHHHGDYGVHGKHGHELDKKLKQTVQGYYKAQGLDEDTIREKMGGRLY